jgi:hypothetical protein
MIMIGHGFMTVVLIVYMIMIGHSFMTVVLIVYMIMIAHGFMTVVDANANDYFVIEQLRMYFFGA